MWLVKRCYEDFRVLDKQIHRCIYDRRFSQLAELPKGRALSEDRDAVKAMLSHYLNRFSEIAGDRINCGPVLNWMEIDNHGNRLVVGDDSAINIPAVAAAHVIKRYIAQAPDEITLQVGDIVSVIDMPPSEDSLWWHGKRGFEVGFFPSQCVELIGDIVPPAVASKIPKTPKPVLRRHGKLITFLRSFLVQRPTKGGLKQRGILRERVFGCDLGEHLLNTAQDVPEMVKACTEFIEEYGIVDGIYRLSGVASNIHRLRDDFDSEQTPNLNEFCKDIHCVTAVCKLYFRELPNPLLTYQLYDRFAIAVADEENRLMHIHDTVQQLPPPHYRTLEYLIKHLAKMAEKEDRTGMNTKNLAIVWAPNLLRSREIESGAAAFMEIRVQAVVVEYLIRNMDLIFNNKLFPDVPGLAVAKQQMQRPKSVIVGVPTKLLSLEEAQARCQNVEPEKEKKYIEVGGGPSALQEFHTVIDVPGRRPSGSKSKKSGTWRDFFSFKQKDGKQKSPAENLEERTSYVMKGKQGSLRSVRSVESLTMMDAKTITVSFDRSKHPESARLPRRRSSISCVEDTGLKRCSSNDSYFDDGDTVTSAAIAAATKEFLTATGQKHVLDDSHDPEQEAMHWHDVDSRMSSPMWIDEGVNTPDTSNKGSPLTPLATPRDMAMQPTVRTRAHTDPILDQSYDRKLDFQKSLPAEIHSPQRPPRSVDVAPKNMTDTPLDVKSRTRPVPPPKPSQRPVPAPRVSLSQNTTSDQISSSVNIENSVCQEVMTAESESEQRRPSVLQKLKHAVSPKRAERERKSGDRNSGHEMLNESNDHPVKRKPILSPVDTRKLVAKPENLQTHEGVVMRPRKLSPLVSQQTDAFEGFLSSPRKNRYSLETVLSEYDNLREKYHSQALSPDFDVLQEFGNECENNVNTQGINISPTERKRDHRYNSEESRTRVDGQSNKVDEMSLGLSLKERLEKINSRHSHEVEEVQTEFAKSEFPGPQMATIMPFTPPPTPNTSDTVFSYRNSNGCMDGTVSPGISSLNISCNNSKGDAASPKLFSNFTEQVRHPVKLGSFKKKSPTMTAYEQNSAKMKSVAAKMSAYSSPATSPTSPTEEDVFHIAASKPRMENQQRDLMGRGYLYTNSSPEESLYMNFPVVPWETSNLSKFGDDFKASRSTLISQYDNLDDEYDCSLQSKSLPPLAIVEDDISDNY
ncbi:rho GTPase-activating protein 33-like isoform X2 [Anneissia japonica]|uniref:rho GTPase-activating protein 33-like isoform X2 n=1 Tax=Anneissia japonica TaxID=1529436 RepID=UPI0014256F9E|nr:rho GTPase-activating protein 33-like isoform X2 [Anneissia japonica]